MLRWPKIEDVILVPFILNLYTDQTETARERERMIFLLAKASIGKIEMKRLLSLFPFLIDIVCLCVFWFFFIVLTVKLHANMMAQKTAQTQSGFISL